MILVPRIQLIILSLVQGLVYLMFCGPPIIAFRPAFLSLHSQSQPSHPIYSVPQCDDTPAMPFLASIPNLPIS